MSRNVLAAIAVMAAMGSTPPAVASPGDAVHPLGGDVSPFPADGLLRDGSYLLQIKGSLRRSDDGWVFRAPGAGGASTTDLIVLPCTLLGNLEQLVASMAPDEIVFELSGQVFAYRGRNYLLPTHAPRLAGYVPQPPQPHREPASDGDSAEQILDQLERSVGPVPRPASAAGTTPGATEPRKLLAPGTVLLWRRGWMVREPGGSWSFVFHADATAEADPPMTLLPCLLLEDMEQHAQRSPDRPAMVVSGRVLRYHARNYLLATSFQIARHRTPLRP